MWRRSKITCIISLSCIASCKGSFALEMTSETSLAEEIRTSFQSTNSVLKTSQALSRWTRDIDEASEPRIIVSRTSKSLIWCRVEWDL